MKYKALVQLPFNGKKFNIGFKLTGFTASHAMRGPVNVESLAEKDKALIEKWTKSNESKRTDIEEEFQLTPIVAGFLSQAFPDGNVEATKGTTIFDVLTDKEYSELALPSKMELQAESTAKDNKVAELEEQLAAMKAELATSKK